MAMMQTMRANNLGACSISLVLVSLISAACVSVAERNDTLHDRLRTRAAFDFHCPAATLQITDLSRHSNGIVTSAGVEGCDHRGTYVLDVVTGAWVLNAAEGQPTNATGGPTTTTDHAKKEANQ